MGGFTLLNDIIGGFKNIQRWFHTIKRLYKFIVNTKKIWYNKSKEVAIYVWGFENNKWMQKNT